MKKPNPPHTEIFYHVFQRSFFDSNGDQHGDLVGLGQKLDYMQSLGITSILLVPLYQSPFYHNYFADDFRVIDEKYGQLVDLQNLVEDVHSRGMKIYLDMEIHYVAEDHEWFSHSFQNPESQYSDYILYKSPGNEDPESIIFDLTSLESYDGVVKKVATINLFHPRVKKYIYSEFKYWVDPKGDGTLQYGVDGFRIDHMMDDLDNKGKLTNIFERFWKPLFNEIREINPDILFMGEQADWESFGRDYFILSDIDYMFAFPIKFAIESFHKKTIIKAVHDYLHHTPTYKEQLVFIENHDTDRFASTVDRNQGKLRIGAVFNLLLLGLPILYYGQELGMFGKGGFGAYGRTDGNDIPRREAFRWNAEIHTEGTCLWYKETGPWWDEHVERDHIGISVEEQDNDPESLLNFYRKVIEIIRVRVLDTRWVQFVPNNNKNVLSFCRRSKDEKRMLLININLSEESQLINFDAVEFAFHKKEFILSYNINDDLNLHSEQKLNSFGISIFELNLQ